ncbi:MAG: M14 family metallopeptidase [Anaerolineae bacterium]
MPHKTFELDQSMLTVHQHSALYRLFSLICLSLSLIACQPTTAPSEQSLPTLVRFPTLTTIASPTNVPSAVITLTPTLPATVTPIISATPIASATVRLQVIATATLTTTPTAFPTMTSTPLPPSFVFGQSVNGRDLIAHRHGTGSQVLMIVGGIHAGFEANTIELVERLHDHFSANPDAVEPTITLILIPALNPDGQALGRTLEGRFNGNRVDLNRNWDCDWSPQAFFRSEPVSAGDAPFSELETQALGALIQQVRPDAVIFYHAAANGVFAGACGENSADSSGLASLYGEASGYPYSTGGFSDYPVTGTAPSWVARIGIPALDVELASAEFIEFERNLRALIAVQRWLVVSQ